MVGMAPLCPNVTPYDTLGGVVMRGCGFKGVWPEGGVAWGGILKYLLYFKMAKIKNVVQ